MCTKTEAYTIAQSVADYAKSRLGDELESVVLYGSFARGDFDEESDVDLLLCVQCSKEALAPLRADFIKLASDLSLEYGVEVSLSLTDAATFHRYKQDLPYYENVEREGIRIA